MSYKIEHKPTSNTSRRSHYGGISKPKGITIHHWGSDGQKHQNVVRWLRGRNGGVSNRSSSAHEVISAGLVTILAPAIAATWHSGSTRGNGDTIGLECRPEMSSGDWETLVERCADLEEKWGSLKYYRHSDWKNTACPGRYGPRIGELVDAVNALRAARKNGTAKPSKPEPSKPSKPSGKVPGPGYNFPLPSGAYFGPKSGPNRSYSGFHNRSVKGKTDREWIKEWAKQLSRRGWRVGKGKTYLSRSGNDGLWGSEYTELCKALQREQGLDVDGLCGASTWNETFHAPVT